VATMVGRLLDLADQLVQNDVKSSALKRRAVSTAYYAVFHALAKTCASALLPSVDGKSDAYERVYRALDHGPLKTGFSAAAGPLKERASLKKIGEAVIQLQGERHRADYTPPSKDFFAPNQAETLIRKARQAVEEIEGLSSRDRITLATWLLFKSRSP
jgi:uncharacterized protein (UPF0332 family)